jgi:hypothetical protein
VGKLYLYPVKSLAPVPVPDLGNGLYMYCSLYQEVDRVEILYLYPVKSQAPMPVPELGSACTCTVPCIRRWAEWRACTCTL